jgi:MFS family permease
MAGRSLGRQFGWLWAAYAVSAYGSGLGFGALPLIAVLVLRASPAQVSVLAAVGPAVGALIALPLGPWVEFRRKRPVMIAMHLTRFAVMMTIPVAYAFGRLSFAQLLVVSAVVAAARIAFNAASGAFLKTLVRPEDLLVANARFESTTWSSIAVGPPLGGAAIGMFGPVTTMVADAFSYLFAALGITAIRGREEHPRRTDKSQVRASELLDGWRHLLSHPGLRALYLNQLLVGGLIMATEPLLAVLLLGELGFPPWQYGLAFAAPCLGGLIGSRLAHRVVARYGQHQVIRTVGTLRAVWLIGLAFVQPGLAGLATVMAVELAIIISMSLYNPVLATYRLEHTPKDRVVRTLSAWSISSGACIAVLSALAGLLAEATSPRAAIAVAGLLILASPMLLPRRPELAELRCEGCRERPGGSVSGEGAATLAAQRQGDHHDDPADGQRPHRCRRP